MVAPVSGARGQPSTNAELEETVARVGDGEARVPRCRARKAAAVESQFEGDALHKLWNGPWKFRASGHERGVPQKSALAANVRKPFF